jgi:hypothetical protein
MGFFPLDMRMWPARPMVVRALMWARVAPARNGTARRQPPRLLLQQCWACLPSWQ